MSETVTVTLTDFLLARIAEDIDEATCDGTGEYQGCADLVDQWDEHAKARREIVVTCGPIAGDLLPATPLARHVLKSLALPYADHPDFRDEWRLG